MKKNSGFSTLDVLVGSFLGSVILAGLLSQYSLITHGGREHQIRLTTQVQAQAVVQAIISELRMLGNGVPFDQANFQIGEDTLNDPLVTEPIVIASAASDKITFRLNETGAVYLLTQDFDPSFGLTIHLTSTEGLAENDPIYISNSVVSGDDGFFGIISSVDHNANTISIANNYSVSPDALFAKGSVCEEVPLITFESHAGELPEITRDSGYGPIILAQNASLTLDYISYNGNIMSLPLTNEDVVNSLRSIRVSVSLTSTQAMRDGSFYTATASQTVGIRNLSYFF